MSTSSVESDALVDQLLEQSKAYSATSKSDSSASANVTTEDIQETIKQLTSTQLLNASSTSDFDGLIGYYNVTRTLTARPNDNPVGGKWTRKSAKNLWVIRRTLQHILPKRPDGLANAVAQAVNVIRLDLFFGLLPVWIVLRGDAVPLSEEDMSEEERPALLPGLSPLAVRAYFDRPRIAFGRRWTFSFGPTSSVVLDTPYVDSRVRIGKGGTSGTLFVFSRVADEDTEATSEWKWLLEQDTRKFVTKRKATASLGVYGVVSAIATQVLAAGLARKVAMSNLLVAVLGLVWVSLGTGGIETRGDTYATGK